MKRRLQSGLGCKLLSGVSCRFGEMCPEGRMPWSRDRAVEPESLVGRPSIMTTPGQTSLSPDAECHTQHNTVNTMAISQNRMRKTTR